MDNYSWADQPSQTAFPIARPGYPFILGAAFATAVFAVLELTLPALVGLVAIVCICGFFRDPDRVIPNLEDVIVSPADGKVIKTDIVDDPRFYQGRCRKISIFMSVFNVHVNRVPLSGTIRKIDYHPGKFFNASLDKASADNERNAVFMESEKGAQICFVQVAGLIARRIICGLQPEDRVVRGSRFGLICFGSRLDVYLPEDVDLQVTVGDKVSAGTSVLGRMKGV